MAKTNCGLRVSIKPKMSILQKLLNNKIGIGLATAHWVVILLAFNSFVDAHNPEPTLEIFLVLIIFVGDLPAIIPAALLWLPLYIFATEATNLFYGFVFTSVFTITFQWWLIGKAVYNTFICKKSKLISLALTDE